MAISKKMEEAINKQINAEFYSAYLYLSMEGYFVSINLKGFANWMRVQAQEEMTHGMKLFDYLSDRNGRAVLTGIQAPNQNWNSPLEVLEETCKHEAEVTKLLLNLSELADQEKDRSTISFLQWYLDEQVEEESNADEIKRKLELIKDTPGNLFLMDQELASRVFTNSAGVPSSISAGKAAKPAP